MAGLDPRSVPLIVALGIDFWTQFYSHTPSLCPTCYSKTSSIDFSMMKNIHTVNLKICVCPPGKTNPQCFYGE